MTGGGSGRLGLIAGGVLTVEPESTGSVQMGHGLVGSGAGGDGPRDGPGSGGCGGTGKIGGVGISGGGLIGKVRTAAGPPHHGGVT